MVGLAIILNMFSHDVKQLRQALKGSKAQVAEYKKDLKHSQEQIEVQKKGCASVVRLCLVLQELHATEGDLDHATQDGLGSADAATLDEALKYLDLIIEEREKAVAKELGVTKYLDQIREEKEKLFKGDDGGK
jgi:hypothetical protein